MAPTEGPMSRDVPHADDNSAFARFASRRSVVYSTKGMVASTQPLASEAGQKILRVGGNAADAAVAVAAALNMTEPCSTGIGGDMFCLYFDAKTRKVHALNGSGRSPKNTSLAQIREQLGMSGTKHGKIPPTSALSITVPGAAAGWVDTIEKFGSGKVDMEQILAPAIELGQEGFPVSEVAAHSWKKGEAGLRRASPNFPEMLKRDAASRDSCRAPRAGELMRNPTLADTFLAIAKEGKRGFYQGRIAQSVVDIVRSKGGLMELSDLEDHMNRAPESNEPISTKFCGQNVRHLPKSKASQDLDQHFVELWEHPPNGQGLIALMALGILQELEAQQKIPAFTENDHNTAPFLHAIIEALKIAFADGSWWITDPQFSPVSPADLLSRSYLAERASLFDPQKAKDYGHGQPGPSPAHNHCDTVYFAVVDAEGNGMSFINSNYEGFGSHVIPKGCGFTLQNRGSNFDLGPEGHPNIYEGGKRPYHTIIPGMITMGSGAHRELHSVYGVMGGFMQPQGHVQVLLNMVTFGMNPQQALDAPRVCISAAADEGRGMKAGNVFVEEGIDDNVIESLQRLGHKAKVLSGWERSMFGRGQVISRYVDEDTGKAIYGGGSDLRGDGIVSPS